MDPRKNIFFQYRGPTHPEDEFPRDRQLENNLTKAFLNLLDHTSDHAGRSAFLSVLASQPTARSFVGHFREGKLDTGVQSVPLDVETARHRAILLITGPGASARREERQSVDERRGRPDAWVQSRDGATLLVEAKLGPTVSRHQIVAHVRAAGWSAPVLIVPTTWGDWFNALKMVRLSKSLSALDRFLIDQVLEYLEVLGMAPFAGFQARDFDFFIHYEPTYRARLRQKLEQFAASARASLAPELRRRYPRLRTGNIHLDPERGAWVGILPAASSIFEHCNFAIEITRDGLEFNAVVRDGRAADARKPIGIFSRRLREDPVSFEQILRELGRNYALTVFERTRVDGSTPPGRGNERWRFVARQRLGMLSDGGIVGEEVVRWVRFLISAVPFPGIHVGRHIPRGDPLLQDAQGLAAEAARSFRSLARILEFLAD